MRTLVSAQKERVQSLCDAHTHAMSVWKSDHTHRSALEVKLLQEKHVLLCKEERDASERVCVERERVCVEREKRVREVCEKERERTREVCVCVERLKKELVTVKEEFEIREKTLIKMREMLLDETHVCMCVCVCVCVCVGVCVCVVSTVTLVCMMMYDY